jgi:hypothetical protein
MSRLYGRGLPPQVAQAWAEEGGSGFARLQIRPTPITKTMRLPLLFRPFFPALTGGEGAGMVLGWSGNGAAVHAASKPRAASFVVLF